MAILKSFFFKNADHEDPFHVQWYEGKNEIIYGHVKISESGDECAKCQGSCNKVEEWLCCPVCHQWYHEGCFLMSNLSHLILSLDYINRLC